MANRDVDCRNRRNNRLACVIAGFRYSAVPQAPLGGNTFDWSSLGVDRDVAGVGLDTIEGRVLGVRARILALGMRGVDDRSRKHLAAMVRTWSADAEQSCCVSGIGAGASERGSRGRTLA